MLLEDVCYDLIFGSQGFYYNEEINILENIDAENDIQGNLSRMQFIYK